MCSYVLTGFISLETDFKKWKMANDPPKLQHLKRCVHQSVWGGAVLKGVRVRMLLQFFLKCPYRLRLLLTSIYFTFQNTHCST